MLARVSIVGVFAELTGSSGANCPCLNIVWIRPDQVTKRSFVWNFLGSSDNTDLIEGPDLRTQSSVNTQNLAINNSTEGHKIEHLTTSFPYGSISVLLQTFFVKTVDLRDLSRLMIAANQCYSVRESAGWLAFILLTWTRVNELGFQA